MDLFDRLKENTAAEWTAYTQHSFVQQLGAGTLPEPAFRHYLAQDYLFLIEFARAYALAIYKSPSLGEMRQSAAGMSAILDVEMNLHVSLCGSWGLSREDLENTQPSDAMIAYTRFVLDAGVRSDLLALKVALAPCVIGYAEIGTALATQTTNNLACNPYRDWINEYSGMAYQEVAAAARAQLERLARTYSTGAREGELVALFRQATRLEAAFWQMGLDAVKP